MMPLKGPDRTDIKTLVFREEIHVSGRIPIALISDFLLVNQCLETHLTSSGRLGAFLASEFVTSDVK